MQYLQHKISSRRLAVLAFAVLNVLWGCIGAAALAKAQTPFADRLGVTHDWGHYHFTTKDFLTEGADEIAATGSHVIKLWLSPDTRYAYAPNSTWPAYTNMVDTVKVSYFANALKRPEFHTYILNALPADDTTAGECPNWMTYTSTNYNSVHDAFKNLTVYLMQTYKGTGKTFILQNWESDNASQKFAIPLSTPANANALIGWLNARQDGITDGRAAAANTGVSVYGAAEVNYLGARNPNDAWAIDRVVPWTHMDLYSYSCYSYDTEYSASTIQTNLSYIKTMAPDSPTFGANNVYVGEFGTPQNAADVQNEWTQYSLTYTQAKAALDWGALYVVYWQIFDNEYNSSTGKYNGYWLRKSDGTYAMSWSFIHDTCAQNAYPAAPQFNPNVYYRLCGKTSGMALDNGGSISNSTNVMQNTPSSGNINQQWKIVYAGSGYYNVISRKSGMALDNAGSTTNSTPITQYSMMAGNANQLWQLINLGGGSYNLICKSSGKALDNGGSAINGAATTQYTASTTNANQQWLITPQ